jgi:hypothetical protein
MIEVARPTLEFSCDVKVVMGFMCIMPMLEVVHDLIKFVQKKYIFVCFCGSNEDVLCTFAHIDEQFKGFCKSC